jgi:glycosyltransferase involved in cell wall biosynthesis
VTAKPRFVLVTPARDEAVGIAETILSVIGQSMPPLRWVIVDDGSIDGTAALVNRCIANVKWITLVSRDSAAQPSDFASKVHAVRIGVRELDGTDYDFIGMLDADISLEADYFERLFQAFDECPGLGIAGGQVIEAYDGQVVPQRISANSVAGGVQMFRRQAFEDIGGLRPMRLGGEDSVAEILARMHRWEVATLFHLKVRHHGRTLAGSARPMTAWFARGRVNRSLGYSPLFQLSVSAYRAAVQPPYVISGLAMLAGYASAALRRDARALDPDAIAFLRAEQRRRLLHALTRQPELVRCVG